MEHTPTPWKVIPPDGNSKRWFISRRSDSHHRKFYVAVLGTKNTEDAGIDEKDARFIVQAVNSHDELLAAIQKLLTAIGHTPSETEDVQKYLNEGGEGYEAYSTGAEALTNATKEGK